MERSAIKYRKIKRLGIIGEVWIADEQNGYGTNIIEKTERGLRSNTPDRGAVLYRRTHLEFVNSQQMRK